MGTRSKLLILATFYLLLNLTSTLGVRALAGQVQVAQQVGRQLMRVVGNVPAFHGAPGQLQQRGRVIGHLLDEAHHQRVAAETELLQVHQAEDLPGKVSQQVVVETQRSQRVEPGGRKVRGRSGQRSQSRAECTLRKSLPYLVSCGGTLWMRLSHRTR